jgi:hypothetical protein
MAASMYAARIASLTPLVEIHHYPVSQFDVYVEPPQDAIAATRAAFLKALPHDH